MKKIGSVLIITALLTGCASTSQRLQSGKNNFYQGNYAQAFEQLLPLAENDNANAQYAIGYMYYYGKGVEKNYDKAQTWIYRAAMQGQPQATKALTLLNTKDTQNPLINYPESLEIMR